MESLVLKSIVPRNRKLVYTITSIKKHIVPYSDSKSRKLDDLVKSTEYNGSMGYIMNLKEIYDFLGQKNFANWIADTYAGGPNVNLKACLGPSPRNEFTIKIQVDGKATQTVGTGNRELVLNFSTDTTVLPPNALASGSKTTLNLPNGQ